MAATYRFPAAVARSRSVDLAISGDWRETGARILSIAAAGHFANDDGHLADRHDVDAVRIVRGRAIDVG